MHKYSSLVAKKRQFSFGIQTTNNQQVNKTENFDIFKKQQKKHILNLKTNISISFKKKMAIQSRSCLCINTKSQVVYLGLLVATIVLTIAILANGEASLDSIVTDENRKQTRYD